MTSKKQFFLIRLVFTTEPYKNDFKDLNSGTCITFYIEQESWRDSGPGEALIAVIANQKFWKSEKSGYPEKSKKLKNMYMTSQGLRKVSVGQKPHKHDFPKLKILAKHIFGKNRDLLGKTSWWSHLPQFLGGRRTGEAFWIISLAAEEKPSANRTSRGKLKANTKL